MMADQSVSAYQSARDNGQKTLVDSLLTVAREILVNEGAEGLSMRRVAQAAGCSTTVLYTLFGNKNGIIDALFAEGFQRLVEAHAALTPPESPLEWVLELCRTYRRVALANPMHYSIMFGNPIPNFQPSAHSLHIAESALERLTRAIAHAMEQGDLDADDAEEFSMTLWSVAHGFVSLELAHLNKYPERAEAMYESALRRMLAKSS
jgi:AcrR family transcriptional regulator